MLREVLADGFLGDCRRAPSGVGSGMRGPACVFHHGCRDGFLATVLSLPVIVEVLGDLVRACADIRGGRLAGRPYMWCSRNCARNKLMDCPGDCRGSPSGVGSGLRGPAFVFHHSC